MRKNSIFNIGGIEYKITYSDTSTHILQRGVDQDENIQIPNELIESIHSDIIDNTFSNIESIIEEDDNGHIS